MRALYTQSCYNHISENTMDDILNLEIARELLLQENPLISDEEVDKIWESCDGNPWNAPILYKLINLK